MNSSFLVGLTHNFSLRDRTVFLMLKHFTVILTKSAILGGVS